MNQDQSPQKGVPKETIETCYGIELDSYAPARDENDEGAVNLRHPAKEPSTLRLVLILGGLWAS